MPKNNKKIDEFKSGKIFFLIFLIILIFCFLFIIFINIQAIFFDKAYQRTLDKYGRFTIKFLYLMSFVILFLVGYLSQQ